MGEKSKLYIDSVGGMLDTEAMAATAQVLLNLADSPEDVAFESDSEGHYFSVPTELFDKFRAAVEPKKKRGRPRKETTPSAADALALSEAEDVAGSSNESNPDLEE